MALHFMKSLLNYSQLTNLIIYHKRLNIIPYIKYNKSLKPYLYDNIYNWWIHYALPMSTHWSYSISPYAIKIFLENKKRFIPKKLMYNIGLKNKINYTVTFHSNPRLLHQSTRRELENGKYIEMHYYRYRG